SIASRHDASALDHEDDRSLRSACPMHHAFGHGEALTGTERDGPPIEIDLKAAVDDIEKLVLLVVLVPVELALHDAESYNAVVVPAESLVVPSIFARVDERLDVDKLERSAPRVQVN